MCYQQIHDYRRRRIATPTGRLFFFHGGDFIRRIEPGGGGNRGGPGGNGFFAPEKPNSPTGIRRGSPPGFTIGLSTVIRPSLPGDRIRGALSPPYAVAASATACRRLSDIGSIEAAERCGSRRVWNSRCATSPPFRFGELQPGLGKYKTHKLVEDSTYYGFYRCSSDSVKPRAP